MRQMKQTLVRLALVAGAAAPFPVSTQQAAQPQLPTMPLNAGIHLIQAEVANTADTRMIGLMHRKKLGANNGMLFVFDRGRPAVHVDEEHVRRRCRSRSSTSAGSILNIADMKPLNEETHCATRPRASRSR